MFWEVGQSQNGTSALYNPQSQNSYSYAEGNPVVKKDPDGRFIVQAIIIGLELISIYDSYRISFDQYKVLKNPEKSTTIENSNLTNETYLNASLYFLPGAARTQKMVNGILGETTLGVITLGTQKVGENIQTPAYDTSFISQQSNQNTSQFYQSVQTNILNNALQPVQTRNSFQSVIPYAPGVQSISAPTPTTVSDPQKVGNSIGRFMGYYNGVFISN